MLLWPFSCFVQGETMASVGLWYKLFMCINCTLECANENKNTIASQFYVRWVLELVVSLLADRGGSGRVVVLVRHLDQFYVGV